MNLISANLNEMVDHFEDPEKMLKQAVHEMEQAVAAALDSAVKVRGERKTVVQATGGEPASSPTMAASRRSKPLRTGDDNRARRAITRKIQHEQVGGGT